MYVVCKNILGAHGVSSSENGCFDSSPCNKDNFLQNKRVKVVFGWMVQTKLTLVNGRNNVESGTHIYIFYFLLHCSTILGFMDFIFKTCLSNAFICCTAQKKFAHKQAREEKLVSKTHIFSLSPPIYPNFYCFNLRKLS